MLVVTLLVGSIYIYALSILLNPLHSVLLLRLLWSASSATFSPVINRRISFKLCSKFVCRQHVPET